MVKSPLVLLLMASTHDDAFREIQLSGKQLVFLFMAVVVIAVVIFLTGVQVGRGVQAGRGGLPEGSEAAAALPGSEVPPPPASATSGSSTSPVTAGEKLSYAERLGGAAPPADTAQGIGRSVRACDRRNDADAETRSAASCGTRAAGSCGRCSGSRGARRGRCGTRRRRLHDPGGRAARA